jgi:methyl-accepting chemotaxis protein
MAKKQPTPNGKTATTKSQAPEGTKAAGKAQPPEGAQATEAKPSAASNGHYDPKALLAALKGIKKGDFTARLPVGDTVVGAAIAEAFNDVAELLETRAHEFARIGQVVGKEGRINQRAALGAATGSWAAWVESFNTLIGDLVQPTEEVARVIGAVAKGDLSQRIPLENEGTPLKG